MCVGAWASVRPSVYRSSAVGEVQLDRGVDVRGIRPGAQHEAVGSDLLDPPIATEEQRQRMPADRAGQAKAAAVSVQAGVDDRAQLSRGRLAVKCVVEHGQRAARTVAVRCPGPQRVAHQTGHGRRSGALAAHVADDHHPAGVAGLEHVVEVATDLIAVTGRPEARRELDARDLGQARREQALLQRQRDLLDRLLGPPALGDDRREQEDGHSRDPEEGLGEEQAVVGIASHERPVAVVREVDRYRGHGRGSRRSPRAARSAGPPRPAAGRRGRRGSSSWLNTKTLEPTTATASSTASPARPGRRAKGQ